MWSKFQRFGRDSLQNEAGGCCIKFPVEGYCFPPFIILYVYLTGVRKGLHSWAILLVSPPCLLLSLLALFPCSPSSSTFNKDLTLSEAWRDGIGFPGRSASCSPVGGGERCPQQPLQVQVQFNPEFLFMTYVCQNNDNIIINNCLSTL